VPSLRSARSPPPLSLEHLSLETRGAEDARSSRRPGRHLGDPTSAVEANSRPFMSPRSISSHNTKSQTNLHSATLPIRAGPPPPSGPPPAPPVSAGLRGQQGSTGTTS
jgi:mitogen-activated protein kinase kinase